MLRGVVKGLIPGSFVADSTRQLGGAMEIDLFLGWGQTTDAGRPNQTALMSYKMKVALVRQ